MSYRVTIVLESRLWPGDHPAWEVWDKHAEPALFVNAVDEKEALKKAGEALGNSGVRSITIEKDVDVQALRDQQDRDRAAAKVGNRSPRVLTGLEGEEEGSRRKAERQRKRN